MATIPLPSDFKEFLRSLNDNRVEYLLIGGYAVGYHGYVRATADLDVWVRNNQTNAERVVRALTEFGFGGGDLRPELFTEPNNVVRMGVAPLRIEILVTIDGVEFEECFGQRVVADWDDLEVPVISRQQLVRNKRASGRPNDLADIERLG